MVTAGQAAGRLDLAQHPADDGAQGLLHDLVVGNQAVWRLFAHHRRSGSAVAKGVKRFALP